eukprot:COSAG04_NODE_870_length_9725_cov_3.580303_2_plen_183_part_00
MCNIWGGCGGGDQWGQALGNSALTVGRRTGTQTLGAVGDALTEGLAAGVGMLRALAAEAHEYSTTAGGKCSEGAGAAGHHQNPDPGSKGDSPSSPFAGVCTWAPATSPSEWRSAEAACVERAVLAAVEAEEGAAACLEGGCDSRAAELQRGTESPALQLLVLRIDSPVLVLRILFLRGWASV